VRQHLLRPVTDPDNYVLRDCLPVRHELPITRSPSVANAIQRIYDSTGRLEFNRQEVGSRNIDPFVFHASGIASTRKHLIAPEVETTLIRFTSQEIKIVLPD